MDKISPERLQELIDTKKKLIAKYDKYSDISVPSRDIETLAIYQELQSLRALMEKYEA